MKTDKEFKNEVYARASKERARIKKRNRVIMTAVPCFVIALTAATVSKIVLTTFLSYATIKTYKNTMIRR